VRLFARFACYVTYRCVDRRLFSLSQSEKSQMVENFCSLSERGYEKKSFTRAGHTLWEKKRKRQMNKIQSIDGGREPKDQKGATEETRDEKRLQKVEEKTKGDEKMRLFILTRFSIYEPNSQAYHHPLEVLFSEARMAAKFLVFEALGVAAMKAMVGGACIHWIVCTSTLLPARWLGKLQALLESTGKSFELVRLAPGEGNIWTTTTPCAQNTTTSCPCMHEKNPEPLCRFSGEGTRL
jgi:hypothetical protein